MAAVEPDEKGPSWTSRLLDPFVKFFDAIGSYMITTEVRFGGGDVGIYHLMGFSESG